MKVRINDGHTHEAWLSVEFSRTVEIEDGITGEDLSEDRVEYRAGIKFDGCVHFNRDYNGDREDSDYLHICDLDEVIDVLTTIRMMAKEHFGDHWE